MNRLRSECCNGEICPRIDHYSGKTKYSCRKCGESCDVKSNNELYKKLNDILFYHNGYLPDDPKDQLVYNELTVDKILELMEEEYGKK